MRFECPGCDTILTRDAALNHTKHGGICNTMYPIRHETKSANDHDIEERVKKIEEESNQHNIKKKENANDDEIKKQEEDKEKRLESYRAETREEIKDLNDDEKNKQLADKLLKLKQELDDMKKDETDSKSASAIRSSELIGVNNYDSNTSRNSEYSVLTLGPYQDNSLSGDSLLIKLGSTDHNSKGDSTADDLLISLGSSD